MYLQAQKRKLGLLEEGNMDEQSLKVENAADEFGDFVKSRGLRRPLC